MRNTDRLIAGVYAELHALATTCLRDERRGHSLVPTALVHEAYLRLARDGTEWNDRTHFYRAAAKTIRRVLVDHARAREASKRDGGELRRVTVSGLDVEDVPSVIDVLDLEEALEALAELSPRMFEVVELRYFAGLTIAETALALGVGTTTVEDDWAFSRSWLRRRLAGVASRS